LKKNVFLSLILLTALVAAKSSLAIGDREVWINAGNPILADLYHVFMVNASDGWIVGDNGVILHWNGTEWNQVSSPTNADLRGVYMLNSTDGLAVGIGGVAIHWNGTGWTQVSSGTTFDLFDIEATSQSYYAVGANGTIIMWNGTEWAPEILSTNLTMRSIDLFWVLDLSEPPGYWNGLAVGDKGFILNYSQKAGWTEMESPTDTQLNDIDGSWAVGSGWTIIQWEKGEWKNTSSSISGDGLLNTLDMATSDDGWAMGYNGTILHWNGASWEQMPSPTTNEIKSVFMIGADDGWAVGVNGTILHWNGAIWIPEYPTSILALLFMTMVVLLSRVKLKRFFPTHLLEKRKHSR